MNIDAENKKIIDSYDYLATAASATECTGLIPTPANTPYERESYEAIYHFQPPQTDEKEP